MKIKIFLTILGLLIFAYPVLADPILGGFRVYTVSCDGTTKTLAPSDAVTAPNKKRSFVSFRWWVNSATPVFIGDSDVATTSTGMPYCTDTASCVLATDTADGNPANLHCKTGGSSVNVLVFGGVK